jgi:hypothetical protein
VLLPRLGLERTLLLGATLSAALGVALAWTAAREAADVPRRGLLAGVAATAGALVLAYAQPGWDQRLMQAGLFRWGTREPVREFAAFRRMAQQGRFVYARDGMDGTVVVHEADPLNLNVRVNGKIDASVADMGTQLLVGHLPMFLHPRPRKVMVVGLGCGATAAAVLRHPGTTADVADILPEMVEAAAHFERWNDGVLRNPRMALQVLDARELLLLTRRRYDVIVSEPTNVWVPGVANLFTRDFYRVVRSRLEPGGMFAQWMQGYAASPEMVSSVVETLREEFPHVTVWGADDRDLIFVAGDRRPAFDPARFVERFDRVRPIDGLPSPPRTALAAFLHPVLFLSNQIGTAQGMQVAWPRGSAVVYRDLRPRLEFQAARAQFVAEPFKARLQIDERRTRLAAEPLFLEEYLARYPLDDRGRLALGELLTSLGGWHAELGAAINAGMLASGAGPAELLARLPDAVLSRLVVSRQLGAAIDRAPLPPAAACEKYLEAEQGLLAASRSVFGRLDTAPLESRIERCIAAAPERGERLRIGLARALADAGAAEPAVRRIRAIQADGLLDRLQPRDAAALLVSGSTLLLQSPGREQAFPWASRALQLDPFNVMAARIVWALKAARPGEGPSGAATTGATAPPG